MAFRLIEGKGIFIPQKHIIAIAIAIPILIAIYLWQTNWFFDREMYRKSGSLLREVIKMKAYRIDKSIHCPIHAIRINIDSEKLITNLLSTMNDDIRITGIMINDCPSTALRMTGDLEVDSIFNNSKEIRCETQIRFGLIEEIHKLRFNSIKNYKNYKYHSFYSKKDCTNNNFFLDKVKQYPDRMFSHYLPDLKTIAVPFGQSWIIKYKNYYYLILERNGLSNDKQDTHQNQERYLIFKKLSRTELMHFDNGSYWKLISEYGIKVD